MRRILLAQALAAAPQQPATAFWRALELEHVARSGALPLSGVGIDLGCGDGAVTRLLAQTLHADWRLVGVDPDPGEASLARASGIYERVHSTSGAAIPEPSGSVDFVLSNSVLEHIPELDPVLREIARVLRPGGRVVATVPGPDFSALLRGPTLLGRVATGAADRGSYVAALDRRLAHVRYWTEAEWRAELDAAGLVLVETSGYLTRTELRRWETLSNATGGLVSRLTGGSPIGAQRRLGLRRTLPGPVRAGARALAPLLRVGVSNGVGPQPTGCLLVVAEAR